MCVHRKCKRFLSDTCCEFMGNSAASSAVSRFIMVGLTAIVGLMYGEAEVHSSSSSSPHKLFLPLVLAWALRGWKQFLQDPGFHTCSANSLHTDILHYRLPVWARCDSGLQAGEASGAARRQTRHDGYKGVTSDTWEGKKKKRHSKLKLILHIAAKSEHRSCWQIDTKHSWYY